MIDRSSTPDSHESESSPFVAPDRAPVSDQASRRRRARRLRRSFRYSIHWVVMALFTLVLVTTAFLFGADFGRGPGSTKLAMSSNEAAVIGHEQAPSGVEARIRASLKRSMPGMPAPEAISTTPMAGIYEMRLGPEIVYSDQTGDRFLIGQMFQGQGNLNITQARIDRFATVDFSQLPFEDALKVVKGDGKRQIAVFSDPNCPYCKKLEQELKSVDNVTIYTFLIPILGQNSVDKVAQIWCAKDPVAAYEGWMLKSAPPPSASRSCNVDAIQRNLERSRALGVRGTPAIIFQDGFRSKGLMTAEQINAKLQEGVAK